MIKCRNDLREYIKEDQQYYNSYPLKRRLRFALTKDHLYMIRKYMILLRKEEYYFNKKHAIFRLLEYFYAWRKNSIGNKLGFYIRPNVLGKGAILYHHGNIIIHGNVVIGEGCKLHGCNCIGNNGDSNEVPHIGNNVDIGFGASIIGDVQLADGIKVGAGAVVVKSCNVVGATLIGIPAHIKE